MLLSELISDLEICCVFPDADKNWQNRWVASAVLLTPEHGILSPSALYITEDSDLAEKAVSATVLLIGSDNRAANQSIGICSSEITPETLVLRAQGILKEYGRFLSIQRQLLSLMARRRPLVEIYENVHRMTGFPMSAGTSNGPVIYITEEPQTDSNDRAVFHLPYRSARADWFAELSQARVFEKSEQLHEPYYLSDIPSLPCPFLGLNYPLSNTISLYIVMFEHPGRFTPTEYRLIRLLAQITAHYMQMSAQSLSPESPLMSLMLEVLENKVDDPTVLRDRISSLPAIRQYLHFSVLVFSVKECEKDNAVLPYHMRDLSAIMEPICSVIYQDKIVMLLALDSDNNSNKSDFLRQEDYLKHFYLSVGISARFSSLEELRTGYEQALLAIHFGQIYAPHQIVWHYNTYMLHDLLSRAGEPAWRGVLLLGAVNALLEYDDAHGVSLTRTLNSYLHTYSQTKTAELLGINRSTVIRHLSLIREITGLSLESGSICLLLRLTFIAIGFNNKTAPAYDSMLC